MVLRRRLVVCASADDTKRFTFCFLMVLVMPVLASYYYAAHCLQSPSFQRVQAWILWWNTFEDDDLANDVSERNVPDNFLTIVWTTAFALVIGSFLLLALLGCGSTSTTLAVVTIYPALGVQLSTERRTCATTTREEKETKGFKNKRIKSNPLLFLPRDQIVDCIVYEVILSHKVVNMVAFRILQPLEATPIMDAPSNSQDEAMKDRQRVRLIPAFPDTEMTYEECLYMRREILQTLGGLDKK